MTEDFAFSNDPALIAAKVREADANAARADALARKTVAEAMFAEIVLAREQDLRSQELSDNYYHKVYHFTTSINGDSARACMRQLSTWHRLDPACDMEIIFSSPGGSVIDGMALYDYIKLLRSKGHRITTGALGYAASMAGILLQAGDHRWMGAEASLLIHEGSFGASGTPGQVEDTVEWVKKIRKRIVDIFVSRAKPLNPKTTHGFVEKNWNRKDWWLDSSEALKYGFVDEVR